MPPTPTAVVPTRPLLSVEHLSKYFPVRSGVLSRPVGMVRAIDDVSFDVQRGEVVGLVGESGSGKTTIGRAIIRLIELSAGKITFDGIDVSHLDRRHMRPLRQRMQIVFQDPFASLSPRMTVNDIISEALAVHHVGTLSERQDRIKKILLQVGLPTDAMQRFPHEFSGGERQRISIARSLSVNPSFVVADEPVSALDVSVQAQILNLIRDIRAEFALTVLFIAHDLAVVEYLCDRVIVMYLGQIMEIAPNRALYAAPKHPYTEALLSAIPVPDPDARRRGVLLERELPSPLDAPSGCVFRSRCAYALPECAVARPPLREVAPGHLKACIRDDIL